MKTTLFLAFLMASVCTFGQVDKTVSTYYLIRHAEKSAEAPGTMAAAGSLNSANPDPELSPEGVVRAQRWAQIFQNIRFDAVYSTNYIRTKTTALPTAKANNLDVLVYDPKNFDYDKFKTETKGKTVLIVGHSNTIPGFTNKLIGADKYPNMADSTYGNLYIVQINNGHTSDILLSLP
jgi:2,3-bisphosphoglycerate-dependent phosphoglycerate mutase